MIVLLLILLVAAALFPLRIALFEATVVTIILAPVFFYLVGLGGNPNQLTYISVILGIIGLFYLACLPSRAEREASPIQNSIEPLLVWSVAYIVCFRLCLLWPDFVSMGERIRDYAVLSSTIHSPIQAREPWMSGYPMNYYVYWYRFGHMLSSLFGLETWQVYHRLQSLTFSLFIACAFQLFRRWFKFSLLGAIVGCLIVGFGSNVEGIIFALYKDTNWWGPSRVVAGAINEFPAWSFLLGDLHPHYLNLPIIPASILVILSVIGSDSSSPVKTLAVLGGAFITIPLLIYNSNAWELPIWLLLSGSMLLAAAFTTELPSWFRRSIQNIRVLDLLRSPFAAILFALIATAASLYLSSRNILPADDPTRWVKPPIPKTTLLELFRHWGLPLTLIVLSNLALIRPRDVCVAAALLLIGSTAVPEGIVFLYLLLLLNIARLWLELRGDLLSGKKISFERILPEVLGLVSIALIIVPELVFRDDPYGGENERMNTIFKVYTVTWFLVHSFALYLTSRSFSELKIDVQRIIPRPLAFAFALALCLNFTFRTAFFVRRSNADEVKPVEEGLSLVERQFKGAGTAIKAFADLPFGTTIEAQGNPYSMTTHVATLGGKDSFLGWANHVNLLNRAYDEVKRREDITKTFYESSLCTERRDIMERERIQYVVFGPLERKAFPSLTSEAFSCLTERVRAGEYEIFEKSL